MTNSPQSTAHSPQRISLFDVDAEVSSIFGAWGEGRGARGGELTRRIDLQLFAEEKTEPATPRRREEARKKGQVLKSVEVVSALVLLACFATLRALGPYLLRTFEETLSVSLELGRQPELSTHGYTHFLWLVGQWAKASLPLMMVAMVVGVGANVAQVGFALSSDPLTPNFGRLNPVQGFARIFSKRALFEMVKSLAKLGLVGWIVYQTIEKEIARLPQLLDMEIGQIVSFIAQMVLAIGLRAGLILIVVAAVDYFYQWRDYEKNLRMSKQEIKEEYKQTEGNPQIKSKIREKQRQMSLRRMMQEVPKADVIITNPTHFAVALAYREHEMSAPQVVAKGQDYMAQRIKALALESKVTIVENKPLARALYQAAEVGDSVPSEFYQAVAEVLAFVYRLKRKAL
ncbi:MAG: flagellar biosynthesis protein FlhB [Bacillota bacterium]